MNEIILNRVNAEPIMVKTISAAWNKVREIRNTTPTEELNGQILAVTLPEGLETKRIPNRILFRLNKNGKIEFKDAEKVAERVAKKLAKKNEKAVKEAVNRAA